jgi:ribosomal protein L7/L12
MNVTLWFKPGENPSQVVTAIKDSAHIPLGDAKDAVEIQRVTCKKEYREDVIKAIEDAGGFVE